MIEPRKARRELLGRERHHRADGSGDDHQGDGPRRAEEESDGQPDDEHAHHRDDEHVLLDRAAVLESDHHRPGGRHAHLRVKGLGRVAARESLHRLDELLAGALLEDPRRVGGQREHPGVVAVGEGAIGKATFEDTGALPLPDGVGQGGGLGVVVQVERQRILAREDLGAQTIAPFREIGERGVEPGIALDEVAGLAHLVGRQRADLGRQALQVAGKGGGVAQVGGPVRRLDGHHQGAKLVHAPGVLLQDRDGGVTARQQLSKGGAELQPGGDQGGGDSDQGADRENQPCALE